MLIQRANLGRVLHRLTLDLGVAERVVWLNDLTLRDLVAVIQGAHALLQPSLMEGFGLPALDAISCECPVIYSDIPALVEVVGGADLHAAAGNAWALAAATRQLNNEQLRVSLRGRGLERAADFRWDQCAKTTLEIYLGAARQGRR